ncbi:MAG: ABC transporter permease [Chloroflexota bacterium]
MPRYLARRLLLSALVLLGAVTLVFVVTRTFADPARLMVPIDATEEDYQRVRKVLHLDDSILVQYARFLRNVAGGEFGESYWQRAPALNLVNDRIPATLQLAITAILVSAAVAIPLGVLAAAKPGSWLDRGIVSGTLLGVSVAEFWLGLILIVGAAAWLQILPTSGYGTASHLVLPALTLAVRPIGRITQIVRSSMLDELARPHITVARAKGLREAAVFYGHGLKNASIPIVTLGGLECAELMAGYTIVVETVFAWPGIGQLGIQALQSHDLPVIEAVVVFSATVVIGANVIVDLLYGYLDPRLSRG